MVVSLPDEARDSRHRAERARDSDISWFGAGGGQRSRGSGVETPVWVTCHPSLWTLQCMGHFLKTRAETPGAPTPQASLQRYLSGLPSPAFPVELALSLHKTNSHASPTSVSVKGWKKFSWEPKRWFPKSDLGEASFRLGLALSPESCGTFLP